jgi:AbrB family looped-hinge helix DNA binding protein
MNFEEQALFIASANSQVKLNFSRCLHSDFTGPLAYFVRKVWFNTLPQICASAAAHSHKSNCARNILVSSFLVCPIFSKSKMRLFQNFSFGTATLDLIEKSGLRPFFREPVPKLARVLELAQIAEICDSTIYFFAVSEYTYHVTSRILEIGGLIMNLAKVSANGQITVPVEIRRILKLKEGDKMLFFQKENGEIVVNNTALVAIGEAQCAVAGSAYSEEEILAEVMRLRYGDKEE